MRLCFCYMSRPAFSTHFAAVFLRSFTAGKPDDLMKSIYRRCRQAKLLVDLDWRLETGHSSLNKYAITDHFPSIFPSALSYCYRWCSTRAKHPFSTSYRRIKNQKLIRANAMLRIQNTFEPAKKQQEKKMERGKTSWNFCNSLSSMQLYTFYDVKVLLVWSLMSDVCVSDMSASASTPKIHPINEKRKSCSSYIPWASPIASTGPCSMRL